MSSRDRLCMLTWMLVAILALATFVPSIIPDASAQGARNVTVLVGGGQDTVQALAFFPQTIRIRQGDTVTWKDVVDEPHTTTFTKGFDPGPASVGSPLEVPGTMIPGAIVPIPGAGPDGLQFNPQMAWPTRAPGAPVEQYPGTGLYGSGIFSRQSPAPGVPANDTFQLTFPTTGSFFYLCLVHPMFMFGTVEVVPSSTASVPSQAEIDAQASKELAALMQLTTAARAQGDAMTRSEPGPNGSTLWFVRAGNEEFNSVDGRAQLMDFQPKNLAVNSGDTVVWSSSLLHSITFTPTPPFPDFIVPVPSDSGPPMLTVNPRIAVAIKPDATYDPTQYYNSGLLGRLGPFGNSWALTFTQPGIYEYSCQVHADLGMKGSITVR